MGHVKPNLLRRAERRVISGAMGVVAFFLERIVLRAERKSSRK